MTTFWIGQIGGALTTTHSDFSVGSQRALRFENDISPFAGARDESSDKAWQTWQRLFLTTGKS